MTTTELIDLLQKVEKGASGRSREISLSVKKKNGEVKFIGEPIITLVSTGDGVAGAQIHLMIECLADDELIALCIQSDKDKIALLVDALKDARSTLLYVREAHGELYGVGFDRVEKKASAALFTVAASESNTGLHAGVKSLREKLKQEANYLQLKDWHKLSFFERQTVKKLENLGFLEKKVADGFVGRSI